MEEQKKNKTKVIIIILAILLAISVLALAGTLIYNQLAASTNATVTIPDNLITSDEDKAGYDGMTSTESGSVEDENNSYANIISDNTTDEQSAITIALYNKQTQDNTAFSVVNMFPGDSETKYYRVRVSYHDAVTVHFKADIQSGYEKLAEVLKVKVKLLSSNEVMYDGLMKDMPDSVTHRLTSVSSTTDELYYEIIAYLDTSVGNEYQNQDLIADFNWWVEETGNLDSPQTGYTSNIVLWSVMAVASGIVLLFFACIRRKREDTQNDK